MPMAMNVLTSLAQMIKDLHTAAKCPIADENWDTHQLNPDALLQIKMALYAASQIVALATLSMATTSTSHHSEFMTLTQDQEGDHLGLMLL